MSGKVFITGVAGFLGCHLAETFLNLGYQVAGIDNMIGGYREHVPAGVEFRVVDCNDRARYLDMLQDVNIVYHCAAAPYEGISVFSPQFVHYHTCNTTVALLSAAVAMRVKRFVFCSSMARYGNQCSPFKEDMPGKPVDPYGIAKYSAELMVQNICQIHGMEYNIAVPHNIIGPRQRYDDPYRNVASIMIHRMLKGQQPVIYGDGSQKRCFSFIADVIYCLVQLGTDANVVNDIFNIGPDEEVVSILELAHEIAALLDFPVQPVFVAQRPQEVHFAICSAEKARKILGYRTTYTLHQGLQEMVEWIKHMGLRDFQYHLQLEIVNDKTPVTWTEHLI